MRKTIKKLFVLAASVCMLCGIGVMPVSAKTTDVTITGNQQSKTVSVTAENAAISGKDISVICYNPSWDQNPANIEGNLDKIEYLDQYTMTNGKVSFTFPLSGTPVEGEYALVIGSEDAQSPLVKKFRVKSSTPQEGDKTNLTQAVKMYEAIQKNKYTTESWAVFETQLKAAKAILSKPGASQKEIDAALSALKTAYSGLTERKPEPIPEPKPEPYLKKGTKIKYKNGTYAVLQASKSVKAVTFVKPNKKTLKSFVIPSNIVYKGQSYKVTAVSAKAFYKNRKLGKVTIGANAKQIGNYAFKGCGKLKTISIKGKSVTKFGKGTFQSINKKAKFMIPSKQYKKYKKAIIKAGAKKTMTFKKTK